MITAFLSYLCTWVIAFVLLAASYGKLKHFEFFKSNLVSSFKLKKRAASVLAPLLVIFELFLALIISVGTAASYWAMFTALILFTFLTLILIFFWVRDGRIRCNCFGEEARPVSGYDLIRNSILILALGLFFVFGSLNPSLSIWELLLIATVALPIGNLLIRFHDIFSFLKAFKEVPR